MSESRSRNRRSPTTSMSSSRTSFILWDPRRLPRPSGLGLDGRVFWLAEGSEGLLRQCGELSRSHQGHRTLLKADPRQAETTEVLA
jgi:hypothetical protein